MKILKRGLVVLSIFIMVVVIFIIWMGNKQKKELANIYYPTINMMKVADGTYTDEAKVGLVFAKVEVTIENNQMKEIKILEHNNGMGKPAEVVVDKMIELNNFEVDAISGATTSSEALKSAVGKALNQGQTEK